MNCSGYEMRAITIRNFSIPPSPSLTEIYNLFPNDYISYQNHQIVQISAPKTDLSKIYTDIIVKERGNKLSENTNNPHMSQTITLVGKPEGFWEQPSPFFFITFLQTKDYDAKGYKNKKDRYSDLTISIQEFLKKRDADASFALYYAYDFCDYILFVKNTTAKTHNSLVWQLTMGKNKKLQCIRDTFSFYAISISHLKQVIGGEVGFSGYDKPIMPLAARMSIYSSCALMELKKGLKEEKIQYAIYNIFGRYDIEIRTRELTFISVCKFIDRLEKAFEKNRSENAYAPFGGYEILPFSAGHYCGVGRIPLRDPAFVQTLEKGYINALEACVDPRFTDYIDEAKRSLRELLISGFSTEFILGCLAPFSYAIKNLYEKDDITLAEDARLVEDARRIFDALNTLTLCMMHGERRFIQAPAFGATYFDIPSKLFAYYAVVVQRVKECYKAMDYMIEIDSNGDPWEAEDYQFLMVPDFRKGINVIPICRTQSTKKQKHLCIIYLSEGFFYSPLKAIYLIAQEMAHYIGIRRRKERLTQIIYTVSCIMMCAIRNRNKSLTKDELDSLYERQSLIGKLAQVVAEYLLELYIVECGNKHDPYLYNNIKIFLDKMDYGFALFYDKKIADEIAEAWAKVMSSEENSAEILRSITRIQRIKLGEGVTFLSDMHNSEQGECFNNQIIANEIAKIASEFNLLVSKEVWHGYQETCKSIAGVFREAFADYRMAQALGNGFRTELYKSLLDLVPTAYDLDLEIRHDAVLRSLGKLDEEWHDSTEKNGLRGNSQYIAIRGVEDYLRSCTISGSAPCHALAEVASIFSDNTPIEDQCKYILKELDGYMEYLVNSQKNGNAQS